MKGLNSSGATLGLRTVRFCDPGASPSRPVNISPAGWICGAGLSAALPGAVAAHTDLPVIGVPLRSSLSVLDGLDALLAIAQMPPGVPVATVGVDNARNAAALALRILSI